MASFGTVRPEIRAEAAANLVASLKSDNAGDGNLQTDNHLYAFIGRENDPQGTNTAGASFTAGDGLWPGSDLSVPSPTQTLTGMREFWNMAIGAQKISPADISLMVPRRNWTTATAYVKRSEVSSTWYNTAFYVMNSLNEVWVCVVAGGGNSTDEPIRSGGLSVDSTYFKDGKTSIYVSGIDGYSWKYLYTMPSYLIDNLLETAWMPVPYKNSLWAPSSDPQRTQGRDDSYSILNAHHVMVRAYMDAGVDGSGKLPADINYRQVAIVQNPLLFSGFTRATAAVYYQKNTVNGSVADELRKYSGEMIYLENRATISRETTQVEEIRHIITF
jgi:hypothetical protein